jgi:hypothetical protein
VTPRIACARAAPVKLRSRVTEPARLAELIVNRLEAGR